MGTVDCNMFCAGGGGKRDRTDDLLHAMQALSQLSYTPPGRRNQQLPPRHFYHFCTDGGGKRDRTDDLLHAMQALSQLSYTPSGCRNNKSRTWRLLFSLLVSNLIYIRLTTISTNNCLNHYFTTASYLASPRGFEPLYSP